VKRLVAILIGALAIGGGVRGQTAPDTPPSAAVIKNFQHDVRIGHFDAVAEALARDPGLAVAAGEFGFSAMNLQDMYFDPQIFALLLKNGADVNATNDDGITLLHILAEPEHVPLLIANGADLEARDVLGRTPLLVQIEEPERQDMIKALLAAGANPNTRGNQGQTPLGVAEDDQDSETADLLRRYGANLR
jgi:ankyrin repeat protein